MTNTVDKRVTELGFDNKQFQSGVQSSLKTIDELKKGLNFDAAVKGLANLAIATSKGFSFESVANGVQNISNHFSALGIMGMTVISNLTSAFMGLGNQIMNSIALAPLKTGFQEYETQMNAIQTVLANTASKGTTLDEVNRALNELNTYSDKTIYNFTQMAKNIGTFTAAGVDLKTATSAIKGIANLAAVSGSNADQASTAMYQLSQAMASGTVKLMDWNSVVNAGMGGQVFQDALKETARAHNIGIDAMTKKEGSFRETLASGWLTTSILTETLSKFTGDLTEQQLKSMGYTQDQIKEIIKLGITANDAATKVKTFSQLTSTLQEAMQSGWTQSWAFIIGDFEQAKALFTGVSDALGAIIQDSSNSRNSILESWSNLGGRTAILDGLTSAFQSLSSIVEVIGQAFAEIFPPVTAYQLDQASIAFRNIAKSLTPSKAALDAIKVSFKGVFAILDIGVMAITAVVNGFARMLKIVLPTGGAVAQWASGWGEYAIRLRDAAKAGDVFNKAVSKIRPFLTQANASMYAFIQQAKPYFDQFLANVRPVFQQINDFFYNTFSKFDFSPEGFTRFVDKLKKSFEPLQPVLESVKKIFEALKLKVTELGPLFSGFGETIKTAFGGFSTWITEELGKLDAKPGLDTFGANLETAIQKIDFQKVAAFFGGGLIAAMVLSIKKLFDRGSNAIDSLAGILDGVTGILDGVRASLEAWQQNLQSKSLLNIAIAIGILAASLIALSAIDEGKLTNALSVITIIFGELLFSMNSFGNLKGKADLVAISTELLTLAGALAILSLAVTELGNLKLTALGKGLVGLGVILAELGVFLSTIKIQDLAPAKLGGLIALSVALLGLAAAVSVFGTMDTGTLVQGLKAVTIILGELILFMMSTGFVGLGKNALAQSAGLVVLSGALIALSFAVERFGNIDPKVLALGLMGMGGVLAELAAFTIATSAGKQVIATAVALVIIGGAMMIFAEAMKRFGNMKPEQVTQGLYAMAIILATLTASLNLMKTALPGAAAMVVAAAALGMLVPVLMLLGTMDLQSLGIGLLAIASIFLIFGVAGLLLGPIAPALMALAAAMLVFGIAALAAGAGILALSIGLLALVGMGYAGVQALSVIITQLAEGIAKGIIRFAQVITEGAPILGAAAVAVINQMLISIVAIIPQFVITSRAIVDAFIAEFLGNIGKFVQAGIDVLLALLKGIADNIAKVVVTVADIVVKFIEAVAGELPKIIQAGIDLMIAFIDGMATGIEKNTPRVIEAITRLGGAIVDGLIAALNAGLKGIIEVAYSLAATALKTFNDAFKINSPSKETMKIGDSVVEGLVTGMRRGTSAVAGAASALGNGAISSMTEAVSLISDAVNTNMDMSPSIRPIVDLTDVIAGGRTLNNLLGDKTLNVSASVNKLSSMVPGVKTSKDTDALINQSSASQPSPVIFNQNNYSPVALSRIDIYRQTRNLLKISKGLVNN